jgi:hypothetical protein
MTSAPQGPVHRSPNARCLLLSALCGTCCGALGPVILFLLLAWQDYNEAVRHLGFFAGVVALFGALPGMLNGFLGALAKLWVGRNHSAGPVELFVPLLMLALVWAWDRGNPKVGLTLLWSLIPVTFVWVSGLLGQAIGRTI